MAAHRPVTILSTFYPPHVVGGAEVNAELLATFAAASGWDVTVLTGASILPRDPAYVLRSLPALRPRPSLIYEPWWSRRTAQRIAHEIAPHSIVHSFDFLARGVAAELGAYRPDLTLVATIQDISPICGSIDGVLDDGSICTGDTASTILRHRKIQSFGPLGRLTRYLRYYTACVRPYRRDVIARHQAVTTVSDFLKDFLHLDQAEVIPDLLVPPTAACRIERTTAPTLLVVGRLGPDKGTDLVLEALAQLPNYLLTFVGGQDEQWHQRAQQLGVAERVTFVDRVPIQKVGCWYYSADVVILGSRAPEASSRTVLEAMSCGRAVVAPDFGGPAELITEGSTGRLYRRNDASSLAAAIKRAYAERQSLGARAKQAAERYQPASIGPQYLRLYQGLHQE